MSDAYGAQLNDVESNYEVTDIETYASDTETVVLDGIFGASICWSHRPGAFLETSNVDQAADEDSIT